MIIFVGCYTQKERHAPYGHGEGITVLEFDEETAKLKQLHKSFDAGVNPTYLCLSQNKRWLYAASEDYAATDCKLTGFEVQRDYSLKKIGSWGVRGIGPCYEKTVFNDSMLLNATYFSGSVISYHINSKTGSLSEASFQQHQFSSGEISGRQDGPHAHCVLVSKDEKIVYVTDLGADRIYKYDLSSGAGLSVPKDTFHWAQLPLGSGPRHLVFHPSQSHMYVSCELSSQVAVLQIYPSGCLELQQLEYTLDRDFRLANDNSHNVADLHVTPDGRFLYVSNRAHHSISEYRIDQESKHLSFIGRTWTRGRIPRNFMLTPDGRYAIVANQDTDNIVVFLINNETGKLGYTGSEIECASPVILKTFPSDFHAYTG